MSLRDVHLAASAMTEREKLIASGVLKPGASTLRLNMRSDAYMGAPSPEPDRGDVPRLGLDAVGREAAKRHLARPSYFDRERAAGRLPPRVPHSDG